MTTDENKGFLDDHNRWDRTLYYLNVLSMNEWSGSFLLRFNSGKITLSTLQDLNELARPYIEAVKQGG